MEFFKYLVRISQPKSKKEEGYGKYHTTWSLCTLTLNKAYYYFYVKLIIKLLLLLLNSFDLGALVRAMLTQNVDSSLPLDALRWQMPTAVMLTCSTDVGSRVMIDCYLILLLDNSENSSRTYAIKLHAICGLNKARQFIIKLFCFAFYDTVAVTNFFVCSV